MDRDRDQQTTEVRETRVVDNNPNSERRAEVVSDQADSRVIAKRIVWYVAGFIVALLALRIVLLLLAANQGNAFVDFIYGLSGFFAMPFYGIFSYQPVYGRSTFEVSSVVAIVIYLLIAWGIAKLFTLTTARGE
jgi:hypothetical protein